MQSWKNKIKLAELENQPKDEIVNVRLSGKLLIRLKKLAKMRNVTLSGYIRLTLENFIFFYER